ncbi:hypothetical protein, partial [Pseudomonas aeruginosa]
LTPAKLAKLGGDYGIDNLHLLAGGAAGDKESLALEGTPHRLAWVSSRPGSAMLRETALPLLGIFVLAAGQQVQVGDAVVAAELGQLRRGQPVDEDHPRGLVQVDGRMIAGGLDRRGDQD